MEPFTSYEDLLRFLDDLEPALNQLPEISSRATSLFPGPTLVRPLCMMKCLTKLAINLITVGRSAIMAFKQEDTHIEEEIHLLRKDLRIIIEEIEEGEIS